MIPMTLASLKKIIFFQRTFPESPLFLHLLFRTNFSHRRHNLTKFLFQSQNKSNKVTLISSSDQKMGQANQKSQIRVENPNDYFLSLTANPQKDQMLAEIYVANQSTYTEWNKMIQRVKESGPTNMLVARSSKIIEKPLCGENFKVQVQIR